MARFLALTLLIGFLAFLPSAFADGESGLFCVAAILFVLRLYLYSNWSHPVGCLVQYNTCGKQARSQLISCYTNARHNAGNCGATMTRFLALTLLIGFFAFLPNAFADSDNGLLITPADTHQTASNGAAMLTLNASNIQVRAKWRLDGDSPFAINDNGELRLTATLSDPDTIVATVIVEDMFSELNRNYQNLAATAFITVEFISDTLTATVRTPEPLILADAPPLTMTVINATVSLHTFTASGGLGTLTYALIGDNTLHFSIDERDGVLRIDETATMGVYTLSVEVSDEAIIPQKATAVATVAVEMLEPLILADAPPLTATAGAVVSLHTFTASGGLGTLTYALVGDNTLHFSIDERSGVLRIDETATMGIYTLSVEVSDGAIIPQRATAMATVKIKERKLNTLYLAAKVSDRPITLHVFNLPSASTYSIVAGNDGGYFMLDKNGGAFWAKAWTPENNYTLSVLITYTYSVPGIPPTEVVSLVVEITDYPKPEKSQIYALINYENDVWSSADGKSWSLATDNAAWSKRADSELVSHNGKIYVLGGYDFSNPINDVWSSENGINWTLETANAGWLPDVYQAATHNGRIYALINYENDVWSSADGKSWSLETDNAAWSERADSELVSHNGKIYVLGGYEGGNDKNDVWSSENGINWTLETANAGWLPDVYRAATHNGRIYALINYENDVWSSADGKSWSLETDNAAWSKRADSELVSHNGKIYVLGGYDFSNPINDVWSSENGINWTLETTNAGWPSDVYQAVVFPQNVPDTVSTR